MSRLSIDFETRSTIELPKTGVYPYATHPTTDIWLMAWAFDDEEPELWLPGMPLPQRVVDHILAGGEMRAWNAQFERVMWREIMVKRYGAPSIALEQWHDTAAEAAAMALPRDLASAAHVLGVSQQKDDAGHRLMLRMARPRRIEKDGTIVWWNEPEKLRQLGEYCKQDVRTERAIIPAIRRLTPHEREVFVLDQRINDRGIRIDRELVEAARQVVDISIEEANRELLRITDGAVPEVTKVAQLKSWLASKDVDVTNGLAKNVVKEMLESGALPFDANRALELRAEAGRSSVSKLDSMLRLSTSPDERARGTMLYHAAGTGRWAGRHIQPHNYPRGEVKDIEWFIPLVKDVDVATIDAIEPAIVVVSSMLRSMMTAAPGKELIVADYSAIEARVLNWLAGQEDMLDLFRRYDAGDKTCDPYVRNAMRLYKLVFDEIEKFPHRQTGKFQELGCGYQMGWRKAVRAAKEVYGLIISEDEAREIVNGYRETHDKVKALWDEANNAALDAVRNPGKVVTWGANGMMKFIVAGAYLYLILPSGRPLVYAAPAVELSETPWGEFRDQVTFWGVNSKTHQWSKDRLYGGLIVENAVQAIARDLLADAMLRLEASGYPIVLHVHDELVAEVEQGFGSVEEFEKIAAALPAWAAGCPVAAEGWRGFRYRK